MLSKKQPTPPVITVLNDSSSHDSNDHEYQDYNFNSNESVLSVGSESTSNDRLLDKLGLSQEDEMILQRALQEKQEQEQLQQGQDQLQEKSVCVPASQFPSLRAKYLYDPKPNIHHRVSSDDKGDTGEVEGDYNGNNGNSDTVGSPNSINLTRDYLEDLFLTDSTAVDPYSSIKQLLEKDISFKGNSLAATVERHYASTSRYSYIAEEAFETLNDLDTEVKPSVGGYKNQGSSNSGVTHNEALKVDYNNSSSKDPISKDVIPTTNTVPSLNVERFRFLNRADIDEYNGYTLPAQSLTSFPAEQNNFHHNKNNLGNMKKAPKKPARTLEQNGYNQRNYTNHYPHLHSQFQPQQYQYQYETQTPEVIRPHTYKYTQQFHENTKYPVDVSRENVPFKPNRSRNLSHTDDPRRQSINSSLTSKKTNASSVRTDSPTLSKPFTQCTLDTTITSMSTDIKSNGSSSIRNATATRNETGEGMPASFVVRSLASSSSSSSASCSSSSSNPATFDVANSDRNGGFHSDTPSSTYSQNGPSVARKVSTKNVTYPPTPPYTKHKKKSSLSSLKNIFKSPISSLSRHPRTSNGNGNTSTNNDSIIPNEGFQLPSPSYSPRQQYVSRPEDITTRTKMVNDTNGKEKTEREVKPHFHRYIFPPNPTINLDVSQYSKDGNSSSIDFTTNKTQISLETPPLNPSIQQQSIPYETLRAPNLRSRGISNEQQGHQRSFSDINAAVGMESGQTDQTYLPTLDVYGRKYSVPVTTQGYKPKLYLGNQNIIDLAHPAGNTSLLRTPEPQLNGSNDNLKTEAKKSHNDPNLMRKGVSNDVFMVPTTTEANSTINIHPTSNGLINSAIDMRNQGKLEASALKLRKACLSGNRTAFLLYGLALRYGCGVHQDLKLSLSYIQKATGITDFNREVYALNIDPFELERSGVPERIVEPLVPALYECGIAYLKGYCAGRVVNENKALKYLEKAASLGHVDSMCLCGVIWSQKSELRKRDVARAAAWFRLADKRGATLIGSDWIYKKKYLGTS